MTATLTYQLSDRQQNYLKSIPERFVPLFERVFTNSGRAPVKDAMRANCLACAHFDVDTIRNCSSKECPTYHFRPYQNGGEL